VAVSSVHAGYNERLFAGRGLRSWLHNARFHWLRATLARERIDASRVLELGCFDAKLLDWLPGKPRRYLGIDANWEKGLDLARARLKGDPDAALLEATSPAQLDLPAGAYTLGVCMETLEHVPPELVPGYLDALVHAVDGHLLVTVPNEMGVVFAAKWLAKRVLYGEAEAYTPAEFGNAVLGRMDRVRRNEHKGFDHRALLAQVAARADIVRVDAIPGRRLPTGLAFGVGIVARTRPR
jgi:hypothetical protein